MSYFGAAVAALCVADSCASWTKTSPSIVTAGAETDRNVMATEAVDHWSDFSALDARSLISEYGVPDEIGVDRLVWNDKGPWRRIVARNIQASADAGADLGIVEEDVDYRLTPAQAAVLADFDDRLAYDPVGRRLSVRSDREEYNILRLNLADDVVHERLDPQEARRAYFKILEIEASGKTSPDLLRLRLQR